MKKKIYWVSQHPVLPRQLKRLKKLFGDDVEIVRDPQPFASAQEISGRYRTSGCDDIGIVAPLSVIDHLCRDGLHPLWAEMIIVNRKEESDVTIRGRQYRFVRFRRIKELRLEFENDFDDGTD